MSAEPKSVCLDTRILSAYLRGKPAARKVIEQYKSEGYEIYTTTMNVAEIVMGLFKIGLVTEVTEEKIKSLASFFHTLHPRPIDYPTAFLAGKMYATRLKGNDIGWQDTLIAASTCLNGKTIITGNVRQFQRIKELTVIEFS